MENNNDSDDAAVKDDFSNVHVNDISTDSRNYYYNRRHRKRPFPSSDLLILQKLTTAAKGGGGGGNDGSGNANKNDFRPPIITSFLAAIGKSHLLNHDRNSEVNEADNTKNDTNQDVAAATTKASEAIASIDDSNNSTLKQGHHQRYLFFMRQQQNQKSTATTTSTWRPNYKELRDFRKLQDTVEQEQIRYSQALQLFWETNKERVMIGFISPKQKNSNNKEKKAEEIAYKFIRAAAYPKNIKNLWINEYKGMKYGKCCQVISMEVLNSDHNSKTGSYQRHNLWTLDGVESQVVTNYSTNGDDDSSSNSMLYGNTMPNNLPPLPGIGSPIPVPVTKNDVKMNNNMSFFLKHDEDAFHLAKRYQVSILAAVEALETVLTNNPNNDSNTPPPQQQRQQQYLQQWMLPIHFRDSIAIVDLPMPQPFLSPRACLTKGLEQGMMQWSTEEIQSETATSSSSNDDNNNKDDRHCRYVLLTLPHTVGKNKTKVLVRVPHQSATRYRAHVEYFPDRSEEIPSSYEQSLWILDHFLRYPRSFLGRVDPTSCRITKWEQTSLAHALAAGIDSNNNTKNSLSPSCHCDSSHPLEHWHRLSLLLQAIPTIGQQQGNYMICLPKRDISMSTTANVSSTLLSPQLASVHMQIGSVTSNNNNNNNNVDDDSASVVIDAEAELSHAGEVLLGKTAIYRSIRDWKWTFGDRIPYTFPPINATGMGGKSV